MSQETQNSFETTPAASSPNTAEELNISDVCPHPMQTAVYDSCSEAEDLALQTEMEGGQRDPIHIMPPGNKAGLPAYTVLDGHRRVEALKRLGRSKVLAIVRHDLKDANAAEVESVFVKFNLVRRHLHKLDQARAVVRLLEIEKQLPRLLRHSYYETEARERVGQLINVSGRHLQRLVRVLLTPREVQRAVRDGHLKIILAEKVAGLADVVQAEIAAKLGNLVDRSKANAVVAAYFTTGDGRHKKADDAFAALIRGLKSSIPDLDGRLDQVDSYRAKTARVTLQRASQVIQKLIKRADAKKIA